MIRISKFFTEEEIRIIFGFIFTMPGVPFLYYGDEIGMKYLEIPTKEGGYHRTGSRTPMQWDHSMNLGFSKGKEEHLYLPVEKNNTKSTVEDALNDPNSLYYYVQKLISLRHTYKDLQSLNNFTVYYAKAKSKLFAYKRGDFLIVVFPSLKTENLKLDGAYEVIYSVGNFVLESKFLKDIQNAFILLRRKKEEKQ